MFERDQDHLQVRPVDSVGRRRPRRAPRRRPITHCVFFSLLSCILQELFPPIGVIDLVLLCIRSSAALFGSSIVSLAKKC